MLYSGNLVILNILLIFKHEYFKDNEMARSLIEEVETNVIYLMMSLLLLKIFCEYFPWKWIISKFNSKNEALS